MRKIGIRKVHVIENGKIRNKQWSSLGDFISVNGIHYLQTRLRHALLFLYFFNFIICFARLREAEKTWVVKTVVDGRVELEVLVEGRDLLNLRLVHVP